MLLRIAGPGHPTRCGFGNSRDRPRASRSSIRFSSWLNSCSSVRTPCSLMKSLHEDRSVYREEFFQATARHPISSAPPEEGTQLPNCIAKPQLSLRFSQVEMLCDFTPGVSVLSSGPNLAGPLIHPSNGFLNLNRLLKDSVYLRIMRLPQTPEVTI